MSHILGFQKQVENGIIMVSQGCKQKLPVAFFGKTQYTPWIEACDQRKWSIIKENFWAYLATIDLQNKFGKNIEKTCIYYPFTHLYHKWKSWYMVPEIWSTLDILFSHFEPFFALLSH